MSFNPRQDVGSPGFVFDKIYTSYDEMVAGCNTDEISVGRYVIILYIRQIISTSTLVYVDISKPVGKDTAADTWWDTAIFQKQYVVENGISTEKYNFITYLGLFNSPPPALPSFLATNSLRDLFYLTSNDDTWIKFKTSETTISINGTTKTTLKPVIYHLTFFNDSQTTNTTLTLSSLGNGSYLNCPRTTYDKAGHMTAKSTDQIFLLDISAIKVLSF